MAKSTRKKAEIWLIGNTEDHFSYAKLPTRGQVLKVLFNFHTLRNQSLDDSVKETAAMELPIWERARIPTKAKNHVWDRLRHLHKEWQNLKKSISRKSETEDGKRKSFKDSLEDLFDIAHQDAMTIIKIEEDRQFLTAQRERGRRGSMAGIDVKLAKQEKRVVARSAALAERMKRYRARTAAAVTEVSMLETSSEEQASSSCSETEPEPSTSAWPPKRRRGTISVVTRDVAAALDRTKTSSRKASHIFNALAVSNLCAAPAGELIISPAAIHRARKDNRAALAAEIHESFDPKVPLTIHWDGKIMPDATGTGRGCVDRLPIMVSGKEVTKLLAIPKLQSGTAAVMSDACMAEIRRWALEDRIVAMCFDTTASNTGCKGGVCIRLETELGKDLLNLACRHHISEIVLEKVFSLHDSAKSPKLELFVHFRDFWPQIDQTKYRTGMEDKDAVHHITEIRDNVISFALQQLSTDYYRDDYKELLELTVIFLGGIPPRGIKFRYPGAVHRARWMARAIYAIKMWLFRDQYPIQQRQSSERASRTSYSKKVWNHLVRVSLFVTTIYVKYWFTCASPKEAPRNDLEFLKAIHTYQDKEVSQVASTAFSRHLWYLSETLVGLSLFDDAVTVNDKQRMVYNMRNNQGSDDPPKRLPLYMTRLQKHCQISSPLQPPKYSASSDWMTLFLNKILNSGSPSNHTMRRKTSYLP